jgi:hypothetical protein
VEKNGWKVNSRGEQDQQREELNSGGIPWVMKKLAGGL